MQKALNTTQDRQALADVIGKHIDEKLSNIHSTQTTINQKVIRETIKEPVYRDCVTTPDGVRLIEDTIHNRGSSTPK